MLGFKPTLTGSVVLTNVLSGQRSPAVVWVSMLLTTVMTLLYLLVAEVGFFLMPL